MREVQLARGHLQREVAPVAVDDDDLMDPLAASERTMSITAAASVMGRSHTVPAIGLWQRPMLTGKAGRTIRVELARHPMGERGRGDPVGAERQMTAVLLDGADGQDGDGRARRRDVGGGAECVEHGDPHQFGAPRRAGSSASRNASPRKLMLTTVSEMSRPG